MQTYITHAEGHCTLTLTAHTGLTLPAIGLGTYGLRGFAGSDAVRTAMETGYRLVDSAFNYENEAAIAVGCRASSVDRSEVLFTTKLAGRHHAYDKATTAVEESVLRSGLGHLDLVLIHWPNPSQGLFVEAWKALIDARERGLIRHIGVSNFLPEHLETLEEETGVRPEVNQIELHPYFAQEDALAFHTEKGIITQAWSPIGRAGSLLDEAPIVDTAAAHGITPTQAVLAWHVRRGALPLPKSADAKRQAENLAAAEVVLTDDEVAAISSLSRIDGRRRNQDPAVYEEF
ncbi:MAG: aldo/keto reductase [Brevibacterium yomogidense]|uniref:Oxidoreductase of aldo/keto reductase family, subgroup 1 n=1 Tax=Brevibacterium yomogidense TaxID=946573 RepID=A0A1X6XFM3_9MICO|nr:oxidoreductase of aldo/keto reductase family, subgroup 1 [Brevibacterium yomogidense]SMX68278.1 Aldo/keto reductase [Brevibacterium sp. Mu109]